MALQKLTRADFEMLQGDGRPGRGPSSEYIAFLKSLKNGEGGKAIVADEGITRQSVKNRLNSAAKTLGVGIKYHRSGAQEVMFEVVEAGSVAPRKTRGPGKKTLAAQEMDTAQA